jgi:hypothetical protein
MMNWRLFAVSLFVLGLSVAQRFMPSVVVVSLAKSGTTSLAHFFRCGRKSVSHWTCAGNVLCGDCIQKNIDGGRAAFENCGRFDVFAQIDAYSPPGTCAKPTFAVFDAIRKYENITVVLSYRRAEEWASSVLRWNNLSDRLLACGFIANKTIAAIAHTYNTYIQETKEYWVRHKWPRFALVNIASDGAGNDLERTFGISAECWGQFNINTKNPRIQES